MATQFTFGRSLQRFAEKAGRNADLVIRKVAVDMNSRIVLRTPVDTGRARGNWQTTIGSPATGQLSVEDPTGASTVAAATRRLAGFRSGPSIFIMNNLPYIERLEYGHSGQSPQGMVRVTAREFLNLVNTEARAVRQTPFNSGGNR
ncbi:hypothetical protein [Caldimonas sp. KR1-144]|uniref:hypothetical protein n=1 Tax=Caldimonas sp. KR1-144 TaxID=3400911 RepID=UPI003C0FB4C8